MLICTCTLYIIYIYICICVYISGMISQNTNKTDTYRVTRVQPPNTDPDLETICLRVAAIWDIFRARWTLEVKNTWPLTRQNKRASSCSTCIQVAASLCLSLSLSPYLYIYIYMYTHTYIYICSCVLYTYIHIYTDVYGRMGLNSAIQINLVTRLMSLSLYIYIYIFICIYMYICIAH